MRGRNKAYCGRDLITDNSCVAGYEADFVIHIGDGTGYASPGTKHNKAIMASYIARCRGQFVHIEQFHITYCWFDITALKNC